VELNLSSTWECFDNTNNSVTSHIRDIYVLGGTKRAETLLTGAIFFDSSRKAYEEETRIYYVFYRIYRFIL